MPIYIGGKKGKRNYPVSKSSTGKGAKKAYKRPSYRKGKIQL